MAKIGELDPKFEEWKKELSPELQAVVEAKPPNLLYRLKGTDQRVYIEAYCDDCTVRVAVTGIFNLTDFERDVFGINPDDLTECELPLDDEPLGVLLTEEETLERIEIYRELRKLQGSMH